MSARDTIGAVATPPGVGGIGVIRVSGPEAERIAGMLFRPRFPVASLASHRLYHGHIVDPQTGEVIDEVLVSLMRGPHSYTGEDTLEISCHGGPLILREVLERVMRCGARPAAPGEFTKRAFLNGRLDLSQAEAVCDLIMARTPAARRAALHGLAGHIAERVDEIRLSLADALACLEAAIDFCEEDGVPEGGYFELASLQPPLEKIEALLATYRRGHLVREGCSIVIVGRPNVGKSSLLNRLLGQRRAIVTDTPGTTRDFIEEALDIGGVAVRLTDTAGIRRPENDIEAEGISLVWERLDLADGLIALFDGSAPLTADDREIIAKLPPKPIVWTINKGDLPQAIDIEELSRLLPDGAPPPIKISAKFGGGIEDLLAAISETILGPAGESGPEVMITHLRQKEALERAARCIGAVSGGMKPELAAMEIREALDALAEIVGRTTSEEIIERIFSRFCVGK